MIRAELERVLRHRIVWGILASFAMLCAVLMLLGALAGAGDVQPGDPPGASATLAEFPLQMHAWFGPLFGAVLGAWCGGAEFGWGTWRIVLARDNRRSVHLASRIGVFALVVVAGFAIVVVALVVFGLVLAALFGRPTALTASADSSAFDLIVSGLVGDLAYGFFAFALAMLTRSFALGLAAGLIFQFVELIAVLVLVMSQTPGPQAWILTNALDALTGARRAAAGGSGTAAAAIMPVISTGQAWATITLYLGIAAAVAWTAFTRRDVA